MKEPTFLEVWQGGHHWAPGLVKKGSFILGYLLAIKANYVLISFLISMKEIQLLIIRKLHKLGIGS